TFLQPLSKRGVDKMEKFKTIVASLVTGELPKSTDEVIVYESSFEQVDGSSAVMVKSGTEKNLVVGGNGPLLEALQGEAVQDGKVCSLTHDNSEVLHQFFDYTKPQAFGTEIATMGLGDRLGMASPGHIETVKGRKVK